MVRHVYMDEGGRSKSTEEPFAVEAAVIVDLDRHRAPAEEIFGQLAAKYLPNDKQHAPFHAKDIWHGTKDFHRDRLTLTKRLDLLKALAEIPDRLDIPVIWGGWFKGPMTPIGDVSEDDQQFMEKVTPAAVAFSVCCWGSELWLRSHARENALIIHEDTEEFKKLLRNVLPLFQSPLLCKAVGMPEHLFPFRYVADELLFASKSGSRMLQIADVCAFFIKRRLAEKRDSDPFFDLISPKIFL
jgi:hypothetical protein